MIRCKPIPNPNFAFLSYGTGFLGMLDISNPGQPRKISTIETPGQVAVKPFRVICCLSPAERVMGVDYRVNVATKDNIIVSRLQPIDVV
jgi:hypothetical protein